MAFPSDPSRYSLGAALSGSPPKHPTILPPAAVRASTRVSLCTAAEPPGPNALRIVELDGALFCVAESSAPSSPSTVDSKPPHIDTSYADNLDMDEWARTPLPDRRKLHHSLWPETPPPPGPPPTIPLPPRPLPRRPLPRQPSRACKTHSRSFSDSISSTSSRALPPPPLDLSGAKALRALQQPRAVEGERVERIVHAQTQERIERSERVERYYHIRGGSLPKHPFAVPAGYQNNHPLQPRTPQHPHQPQDTTQHSQNIQPVHPTQQTQEGAEVKRSGSRLQRVGRIPAQATPSSAPTPEPVCEPRVRPAPTPATETEDEEIHFGTTVQRAQSVSRAHPAIVVDLAGFASDDSHSSNRYAYHDPERMSEGSFGPRRVVPSEASAASLSSQRSPLIQRSASQGSSPSDYSGSSCAPLNHKRGVGEEPYVPPHRRGGVTPSHAPTQSQLLRAIEAQIHDSRPVDFTPVPSPVFRRQTRGRGPMPPLRPGAPLLPLEVPETPKLKHKYPPPIAEAMLALIGRRNYTVQMQEVELRKTQRADECSVVELGGADLERREEQREVGRKEQERKVRDREERERKEKYTFKPPRGLLPSVVPQPPPRPPRSPLRLTTRPLRSTRPDRPPAPSPLTPGEMHDIALTPIAVDFSQPRPYSVSSQKARWLPKRLSGKGEWAGAKPVKLGSRVDLYESSESGSTKKVTLDIPRGMSTALPPRSPGLTPRTPHTPRLAAAEAGLFPTLARRRPKTPADEKKRKKRLMIGLGVGVLIVIVILASVLIAKNKQRAAATSEEELRKQAEEKEAERVREKGLECARSWVDGDDAGFSCHSCFDPLSKLPNNHVNSTSGVAGVGGALQYCTLMNVWDRVEDDAPLKGWGESQSPCKWTGVGCDDRERVISLDLRAPAMPASMPDIRHLVGLKQLQLKGNGSAPTGALDVSRLGNLTLLRAEYTLLQDLKVGTVTSVALVHNPHLSLPDLSNTTITTL